MSVRAECTTRRTADMFALWMVAMFLALLTIGRAQPLNPEGKYVPDNSGQYIHDPNDGKYIPDYSGLYRHDGLGNYADDGTGRYSGQKDPLFGANTFQTKEIRLPPKPLVSEFENQFKKPYDFGKSASGVTGTGQYRDQGNWKIIRQTGDLDLDGYHWEYLTENKINAEESGKLFNEGKENEGIKAKGFFTYTGPDNVEYHIEYTADENGFLPEGDHIPTPPPIPKAILRALEYQRSIGTL